MQKKIIALTLLISSVFASEPTNEAPPKIDSSLGYFNIGLGPLPLPLPVFGLGFRRQVQHHGFDFSLQTSTIVKVTQVKGSALYEYYFKPNLSSQFYAGGGIGVSGLFERHKAKLLLSPEFILGKQYINEAGDTRFMQAQISWPTFNVSSSCRLFWMPLVVFSYGIGF